MSSPVGRLTSPEPVFQSPAITRSSELLPVAARPDNQQPLARVHGQCDVLHQQVLSVRRENG